MWYFDREILRYYVATLNAICPAHLRLFYAKENKQKAILQEKYLQIKCDAHLLQ